MTDERALIVRLHRRAGFGLTAAELDAAVARGLAAEVGRLAYPDSAGLDAAADPWTALDLSFEKGKVEEKSNEMIDGWLTRMGTSARPAEERVAWFWHGMLVSATRKVRVPILMANQVRLFWTIGLGRYADLVRALAVDPAMLLYLDGTDSTKKAPNENFSRELMELFTLGRDGGYTEDDVKAGARALTGWHVPKPKDETVTEAPVATFVAKRHDDSAQTLVGLAGVHDVDTVVKAVTGHPSCAMFVAGKLARAIIGPAVADAVVTRLADAFRQSALDVRTLLRMILDELANGTDGGPVVLAPVPWLVIAERALGVSLPKAKRLAGLRAAGQVPLDPPNVGGWPSGSAWFSSACIVARFNLASGLAMQATQATPNGENPAVAAARAGNPDVLARALGLPAGFSADTAASLGTQSDPAARLVVALTSPEFVLA